jgi:putative hydrolase of the HAD superfamily
MRAVVFDLDETLYPERRFALSGFAAVSREVERRCGVPSRQAFSLLKRTLTEGRGTALQALCTHFDLPLPMVVELRAIIRTHTPRLRLPRESTDVLRALRADWRLGILTNGLPSTQANKVSVLGLAERVDAVIYAENTGAGKPDRAAFDAILDRLGAVAGESVFVGDDPWFDVFGARRAGMRTIRVSRWKRPHAQGTQASDADAVVATLRDVPACAWALAGTWERN